MLVLLCLLIALPCLVGCGRKKVQSSQDAATDSAAQEQETLATEQAHHPQGPPQENVDEGLPPPGR
jgi:hypothetical protein